MCYCLTHWAIPWYMWPSILYFILSRFYPMSTSPGLNSKDANSRIRCLCQWTQPDFKPDFLSRVLSLMDCPLLSIALWVDISSQKKKDESMSVCYAIYMVNGEWFFHSLYCIWCGMHSVSGFVLRQGSTRFLDRLPFHVCFVYDDLNLHPSNLNLNNLNFDPRC